MGGKLALPIDFTYGLLAGVAAILTFATVRINIRFSYYFYVLTKNSAALLESRTANTPENVRYKRHLRLMYLNMLSPLLVAVFFIMPLVESLVVPDFVSEQVWKVFRIAFIIGAITIRMLTFREEIQFHFNESYFYVQKLMTEKNEKVFRYVKLRIQENFAATWYAIFQHAANYILPILLVLCYVNRIVAFTAIDPSKSSAFDFSKIIEKIQQAGGTAKYDLTSDSESLGQVFQEISAKGLLTAEYYEGLFSYSLFWYYFSTTFVNIFSLLYYRKFVEK